MPHLSNRFTPSQLQLTFVQVVVRAMHGRARESTAYSVAVL